MVLAWMLQHAVSFRPTAVMEQHCLTLNRIRDNSSERALTSAMFQDTANMTMETWAKLCCDPGLVDGKDFCKCSCCPSTSVVESQVPFFGLC